MSSVIPLKINVPPSEKVVGIFLVNLLVMVKVSSLL